MQDLVHRPKPLAQPFSIRAAKPWCVVSQRAGQQLYRTSCDLNGRRSHVGPPVFRSRFLVDVLAVNREPNGSEGERFGFAKSNRNCGQHRAGMWAERGCEPYSTPTQVTLRRTTSSIPIRSIDARIICSATWAMSSGPSNSMSPRSARAIRLERAFSTA